MAEKRYSDFHVRAPVGRYSGSERLDPTPFEEPESDTDYTRQMYLDEMPDDPDFQEEIGKIFQQKLEIVRNASNIDPSILQIHAVGQSHIDVAWKWRYEQTHKKGRVTFRNAVYHSRRFPDFRFALSQPQLLEWIRLEDPQLFADIQETVANGGIVLVGGSWVEPDCMMPSGEAMCRTRLYGQKYYRDYFGKLACVEWYTDSFGYNWNLPQIVAKSGGQYFYTSKITWNRQTVFPFVNFWWESPDGTRIITCNFNMGLGVLDNWLKYEPGHHLLKPGVTYLGDYSRDYYDIEDYVADEEIVPSLGYFNGRGDGGHGPTSLEVATMNEEVRQGFAHWSTVKDFFDEVAQWQDRLPIWRDEQYLEYHRGTFTVHAEVKRHNRLYENALLSADNLSSILSALAPDYIRPSALLEDMWKVLLCNQFHDVLPGSSIPEVYDDINDDWDAFDAALPWIYGEAEECIPVPAGATLLLYNPAPVQRKGPVFIPLNLLPELASEGDALKFISLTSLGVKPGAYLGQPVEAEPEWWVARRGAGWWAVVDLEPMSVTPYTVTLAEGDLPDAISAMVGEAPFIDNGIVRVDLDSNTGAITKLASQLVPDVETILQGTDNNLTVAYLDDYPNDHAWNIKPEYWKYPIEMRNDEDMEITLVAQGPVFTTLEVTRTLGEAKSKVWQRVTLMAGCPEVFLEWIADWQETYRMLKVVYDTATNAEKCTADAAYHAIERATPSIDAPSPPLAQWARYEKIMHKYCDVSTSGNVWGVAILNEGKYAFDAVGGRMRLTMLRVPVYTTPAGEAWVIKERAEREAAGKGTVPQFSGIGPFRCRYALLPHAGGALQHADGTPNPLVKNHADAFNAPIVPIQVVPSKNDGNTDESIADGQAWVTATPANASVTVIKPNEWDGTGNLILRVVEICGVDVPEAVQLQLHPVLAAKIRDARAVDILERPLADNPVQWDAANGQISFPLKHFEICTIELVL